MAATVEEVTQVYAQTQPVIEVKQANQQVKREKKKNAAQRDTTDPPKKAPKTGPKTAPVALEDELLWIGSTQSPAESLNLVDRLSAARSTTITTATISLDMITGGQAPVSQVDTLAKAQASSKPSPSTSPRVSIDTTRHTTPKTRSKKNPNVFALDDFAAMAAVQSLIVRYGRVSHMGILDPSYTLWMNNARDGALVYKIQNDIAVVAGDPLCEADAFARVLEEFALYRKQLHCGIAFLGGSDELKRYAKEQKWVTMHFGTERVLNPLTNPILLGTAGKTGKRMVSQNKQLLDPSKGDLTVEVYSAALAKDPVLEEQLVSVYDAWRNHRNESGIPQAFITVYDPFAIPDLMTYIYTRDSCDGKPNGFAALRKLGANNGYHIDPCVATPDAPKGVTDLLIFAAMSLLNKAGISYLSFGFEPLDDLGEIAGMPQHMAKLTKKVHNEVFKGLSVGGKKGYHAKFRPDELLQSGLHLIFPDGIPGVKHMSAMVHIANISMRKLIITKLKKVSLSVVNRENRPLPVDDKPVVATAEIEV